MPAFEQKIEALVDTLLLDYQGGRDIDRLNNDQHPDKDRIVDLTQKLLRILFPGYARQNLSHI